MATIEVGGSGKGRKAVDGEVPLIPFIDLLLCCVMFLLVTAVWNAMGGMETASGDDPTRPPPTVDQDVLLVQIGEGGYVLSTPVGDREEIPMAGDHYDVVALRDRLEERRRLSDPAVRIMPDDGVHHGQLIETMDAVFGAGMSNVAVGSL